MINKTNAQITSNSPSSSSTFGFIGDTHNNLVNEYFRDVTNTEDLSMSQILLDFFDYHVTKNPDLRAHEDLYLDAINNLIDAKNLAEVYHGIQLELQELKTEGRINDDDFQVLSAVIDEESTIQSNIDLSDINMSEAYTSVYNASSEFWKNGLGKDLLDIKEIDNYFVSALDPGTNAMIGDAVGGSMWFWTGFLAPLIAGAYSIACYNA